MLVISFLIDIRQKKGNEIEKERERERERERDARISQELLEEKLP